MPTSKDILTEAKLQKRFKPRAGELGALYAGYYVAELLDALNEEYGPHPVLFDEALLVRLAEGARDVGASWSMSVTAGRIVTELERNAYLRTVQDWIIRPQLKGLPGVAGLVSDFASAGRRQEGGRQLLRISSAMEKPLAADTRPSYRGRQ